ncbi:hypothetical protein [Thaumasiovibrio subtropicus]|uniref:hypothetical protein n=1 Tax=Thaumasiovibrio subtropicus TaxID=1891207 RepID=UPI000B3522F1|nr:hypothetical protein [Thaumasiovibrio subtropicus]
MVIPDINNAGGSMPINAAGGHAGPSAANSHVSAGANTGAVNFGGGNDYLIWLVIALLAYLMWKAK